MLGIALAAGNALATIGPAPASSPTGGHCRFSRPTRPTGVEQRRLRRARRRLRQWNRRLRRNGRVSPGPLVFLKVRRNRAFHASACSSGGNAPLFVRVQVQNHPRLLEIKVRPFSVHGWGVNSGQDGVRRCHVSEGRTVHGRYYGCNVQENRLTVFVSIAPLREAQMRGTRKRGRAACPAARPSPGPDHPGRQSQRRARPQPKLRRPGPADT